MSLDYAAALRRPQQQPQGHQLQQQQKSDKKNQRKSSSQHDNSNGKIGKNGKNGKKDQNGSFRKPKQAQEQHATTAEVAAAASSKNRKQLSQQKKQKNQEYQSSRLNKQQKQDHSPRNKRPNDSGLNQTTVTPPSKKKPKKPKPSKGMQFGDVMNHALPPSAKSSRKGGVMEILQKPSTTTTISTIPQHESREEFPSLVPYKPITTATLPSTQGKTNLTTTLSVKAPSFTPGSTTQTPPQDDKTKSGVGTMQPQRSPQETKPLQPANPQTTTSVLTAPEQIQSQSQKKKQKEPSRDQKKQPATKADKSSATPKSSILDAFGAKQRSEEENVFHFFKKGSTTTSFTKGRQRLQPRKKRFSTLKKKILQERLQQWRTLHPEQENALPATRLTCADKTVVQENGLVDAAVFVALVGFSQQEELEDDDEYSELLDNLRELADKVGAIRRICLPRESNAEGAAFVCFTNPLDAHAAKACWDGLIFGGERLCPELFTMQLDDNARIAAPSHTENDDDNASNVSENEVLLESAVMDAFHSMRKEKFKTNLEMDQPTSIALENVLTEDDYEDPDCLQESLDDIRAIAGSMVGPEMVMEVGTEQLHNGQEARACIVTFRNTRDATNAFQQFQGRVIGGQVTVARLVSDQQQKAVPSKSDAAAVVVLTNVLTEDDYEDKDCLEESLRDIRAIAETHGDLKDVRVPDSQDRDGEVLLEYGSADAAQNAANKLHGMIMGGQAMSATVLVNKMSPTCTHVLILKNLLTEDDLEDEDCLEESKADVADLAGQFGTVLRVHVEEGGSESETAFVRLEFAGDRGVAEAAAKHFHGMVIGGQTIEAVLETPNSIGVDDPFTTIATDVANKNSGDTIGSITTTTATTEPMYSGDKIIPERFAECKRVPKVPNKGTPRTYATILEDETVKPLLTEMLGELMRLQKRAIDEKKAKARRRLVMGLREVARGIRAHKVQLVVMANNLDEYGAIDDKLQEILRLAKEESVPVFFEFNKRGLGKALGKNIKMAVVGVQNAEGAHAQHKKLLSLASKHGMV